MQEVNVQGGSSSPGGRSNLGMLTNTVVGKVTELLRSDLPTDKEERSCYKLRQRWKDLRRSGELLEPCERVFKCYRQLGHGSDGVVMKAGRGKSSFSGLLRCDSVWSCPVCAFRIAMERQQEFKGAYETHTMGGASVFLLTLTMRHKRNERISDTLSAFKKAVKTFKQRKVWRDLRDSLVGHVSVTEVTWHTSNGWHPHLHVALFCKRPSYQFGRLTEGHGLEPEPGLKRKLTESWLSSLKKHDREALENIGLDLKSFVELGSENASSYMFKWGLDSEMMRGDLKVGKRGSLTPFQILSASRLKGVSVEHREAFGRLFREYFYAFKGRKQATWSPGLKEALRIEEKEDSEIEEMEPWEVEWEAYIPYIAWRYVVRHGKEADLLIMGRKGAFDELEKLLDGYFIKARKLWNQDIHTGPSYERFEPDGEAPKVDHCVQAPLLEV